MKKIWKNADIRWNINPYTWSNIYTNIFMPSWKGNIENPVPNNIREPDNRAEKVISSNRAEQVRRDNDKQRNFTISLYDIDETILNHLINLQLQVQDVGKLIKVPAFFGSPEQWTSAQRDGYLRDKQGKLILPAIILKRTSSENDQSLQFFNRYLVTPTIKLYSQKNKYTQFSVLAGQNAPVNEVFNVVVPSHVVLTYHFIIWTEYIEQMNDLVLKFQFNTKDYWGSKHGFRFRTRIESFSHAVELRAGEDRAVKTEFDLVTHGYVLPETITKLEDTQTTFKKMFTPKKMIMGAEIVSDEFDLESKNPYKEKWRNPNYPNLQKDVPIPPPPVSISDTINDNSIVSQISQALKATTSTKLPVTISEAISSVPGLHIVPVPSGQAAIGNPGDVSYDSSYFYIYSGGAWRSVAISELL